MMKRLQRWASVFSQPQTSVGLDIGSSAIKLVQLEHRADRYRLKRFGVRSLEPEGAEGAGNRHAHQLKAALVDLIQELELSGSPVAISVSGPSVMVKRIQVSGVEHAALDEYLTWEGHQYIPYAMSEIYFDYWVLPPSHPEPARPASTETDVLLVAAKQQVVESRKTLLEEIGVHPIVCDVDGLALMKTIMRKSPAVRGRSFVIANVGASGMNIVFVANESPFLVRDIGFEDTSPGRSVDDESEAPVERDRLRVAEVVREVKRCFESVLERDPGLNVEKIFLCGGQSNNPRLRSELQNALAVSTLSFNPLDGLDDLTDHRDRDSLSASAHLGGVAVGLALHRDHHGEH